MLFTSITRITYFDSFSLVILLWYTFVDKHEGITGANAKYNYGTNVITVDKKGVSGEADRATNNIFKDFIRALFKSSPLISTLPLKCISQWCSNWSEQKFTFSFLLHIDRARWVSYFAINVSWKSVVIIQIDKKSNIQY